ncbi:protein DsrB [Leclercia sp. W17]|nr:protein DsrB [Leclercia sp. W6]AXF66956.1 protein DsrB [Leclercia sp. W17]
MAASKASTSTFTSRLAVSLYSFSVFIAYSSFTLNSFKYRPPIKAAIAQQHAASFHVLFYTGSKPEEDFMNVNDRVTVKTDGGPRRPGVVLAVEQFNEGTMYLVSLEDYPLGIWFFNEYGHPDGIFVESVE